MCGNQASASRPFLHFGLVSPPPPDASPDTFDEIEYLQEQYFQSSESIVFMSAPPSWPKTHLIQNGSHNHEKAYSLTLLYSVLDATVFKRWYQMVVTKTVIRKRFVDLAVMPDHSQ